MTAQILVLLKNKNKRIFTKMYKISILDIQVWHQNPRKEVFPRSNNSKFHKSSEKNIAFWNLRGVCSLGETAAYETVINVRILLINKRYLYVEIYNDYLYKEFYQ